MSKRSPALLLAFSIMLLSTFMLLTVSETAKGLDTSDGNLGFDIKTSDASGNLGSRAIQLLAALTVLSLAPSILMMLTSFTKIVIVFSVLRNAIGLQQSPPNSVMISLALFLTFFIMQPTLKESYEKGIAPLIEGRIRESESFEKTSSPILDFMRRNVAEKELSLFTEIAKLKVEAKAEAPARVLIPAFMLSEIRKGFEIGFLIFLPFIVIDILIASVLMSMGMMMLPPAMISLPIKIIFFVLVDGWYMLCGSLVKSYMQ